MFWETCRSSGANDGLGLGCHDDDPGVPKARVLYARAVSAINTRGTGRLVFSLSPSIARISSTVDH